MLYWKHQQLLLHLKKPCSKHSCDHCTAVKPGPQTSAQLWPSPRKDLRIPFPFSLALFISEQCRMPGHYSIPLLRVI